jgi:hypothetical protein
MQVPRRAVLAAPGAGAAGDADAPEPTPTITEATTTTTSAEGPGFGTLGALGSAGLAAWRLARRRGGDGDANDGEPE